MGVLTDAMRGLKGVPLPRTGGRMFVGWGGDYIGAGRFFRLPNERDYQDQIGDGSATSLVSAVVNWKAREITPARLVLQRASATGGVPATVRDHAALDLLRHPTRDPKRAPNGWYSGTVLRQAMLMSLTVDGNAYAIKVRSAADRLVQLWYVPHALVEPMGPTDGSTFIEYYRYRVGGQSYEIAPRDMWHRRFGIDPENPRRGMSPLRGVLREVYTDEEYARFSAALAHNFGFPGAVVVPGQGVEIDEAGGSEIKKRFDTEYGGDGRGRTIVLSANAEVKFLSWSPKDLDLSSLRDVPEERVAAATGIPAAVLGFGTGMQQVKVGATLETLQAMAWSSVLIPDLELEAEDVTAHILPEFGDERGLEAAWDLSRVAALSEIRLKQARIEGELVGRRIKMVDEARFVLGLPAVGGEDGGFMAQPGVGEAIAPQQDDEDGAEDEVPAEDATAKALAAATERGTDQRARWKHLRSGLRRPRHRGSDRGAA